MKERLEAKLKEYEAMLQVATEKNLPQKELLRGKVLMLKEVLQDIELNTRIAVYSNY